MLEYGLFKGRTVNRWLISGIREEAARFEPVALNGSVDVNLWLKEGFSVHENPSKTRFIDKNRAKKAPYADKLERKQGGSVFWDGYESELKVYFPFSDVNVNKSSFWFEPTYLSMWAAACLKSPKKQKAFFTVKTCGRVNIWLNSERAVDFSPFIRNIEHAYRLELDLEEGLNDITVFLEDLAERDTYFYFRLDCESDFPVTQCVPVKIADAIKIKKAEAALADMAFTKNTFTEGDIILDITNPFENEALKLKLRCAFEENLQAYNAVEKEIIIPAGAKSVSLGPVTDYPMGYLAVKTSVNVSGVEIENILSVENYPLELAGLPEDSISLRKRQTVEFLAKYGENNINRAVALLHSGGSPEEIEKIIRRQMTGINKRYDCSDFFLVYFPYIWREFGCSGLLSQQLLEDMKACMLSFRYWLDEPGDDVMWFYSENHALLFHACRILAGELFPDEVFTNSGLKGRQAAERAKELLLDWFSKFFEEGFTEWSSSAYLPVDALGFGCLYAHTADKELKELAKRGLDFIFYQLAVNSKNGYLACSAGRIYMKELMGNYINASTSMSYVGYGFGNINQAAKGVLAICLSDYEPPAEYKKYLDLNRGQSLEYRSVQGFEKHVNIYTYKTADFMLSSAWDFRRKKPGYQEHVIHCAFDPVRQLWINHPGELAFHGSARPSYFAGNGYLPRVNQYKGFASIFYDINNDHTVDFTHLYLPVNEFDCFRQAGKWIFVRAGSGYCAVYAHNGLERQKAGPFKYCELISPGYKNTWIIRASDINEFSSLDEFADAVLKAEMTLDGETQALSFNDPVYGKIISGMGREFTLECGGSPVFEGITALNLA